VKLAKEGRIGQLVAGRYLFTRPELSAFSRVERLPGRPARES
jgi:hypothetical protein